MILRKWFVTMVTIAALLLALFGHVIAQNNLCLTNSPTGGLLYRINETDGLVPPSLVLDMTRDLFGSLDQIQLSLMDNPGGYFELQGKQLSLVKPIDRENEIPIGVIIDDINDNDPTFINTPYFVQVSELTPVGTTIFTSIQALDPDSSDLNSRVEYAIVSGAGANSQEDGEALFSIPDSSLGAVVLSGRLDFESKDSYRLLISATDRAGATTGIRRSAQTTLEVQVLDSDDQPPSFTHPSCGAIRPCAGVEYRTNIQSGPGTRPGILSIQPSAIGAIDLDSLNSQISYSFINGTPGDYNNYFRISPNTGQVFLLQSFPATAAAQYIIGILAQEGAGRNSASLATLKVIISPFERSVANFGENQFDPVLQLSSPEGYIESSAPIGTTIRSKPELRSDPVQVFVSDDDLKPGMAPATYQYMLTGNGASVFAVNQGGYVYLNVPRLDANPPNPTTYQLTIQAREVGTTPIRSSEPVTITISVRAGVELGPSFPQEVNTIRVTPNQDGSRELLKIEAEPSGGTDGGTITYTIASVTNNGRPYFRYSPENGSLSAVSSLPPGQQFQVLLEAKDALGRKGQAVVIVDVDPEAATRPPPQTGSAATTISSSRPPILLPSGSIETVPESVAPGQVLTQMLVNASTALQDEYTFQIIGGNEEGKFTINPQTGQLSTVFLLDYEQTSVYNLLIKATDRFGRSNTTSLRIVLADTNDNPPVITNPQPIVFTAPDQTSGAFVGLIEAVDGDDNDNGRLTYRLQYTSPYFAIDSTNGTLYTRAPLSLADQSSHVINVIVSDNGVPPLETNADVTVNVVAREDRPPYFEETQYDVEVPEKAGPVSLVTVKATDPDAVSDIRYVLRQGDPTLFAVDPISGAVSTVDSLDAEINQQHSIIIGTSQNTQNNPAALATVNVRVIDKNDQIPTFQPMTYAASISEGAPIGTSILQVAAVDQDVTPPNNEIRYKLSGLNDADTFFDINGETGLISIAQELDQAPDQNLVLYVEAQDGGDPPLSSTATVAIRVTRPNQILPTGSGPLFPITNNSNPFSSTFGTFPSSFTTVGTLQFDHQDYEILVSEGPVTPYAAKIMPVINKPADIRNLRCQVEPKPDLPEGKFQAVVTMQGDCELRIMSVDRENGSLYVVPVTVKLLQSGGTTADQTYTATVRVEVMDINDNAPQFVYPSSYENILVGKPLYYAALLADSPPMTDNWFKVQTTDADTGPNGKVTYSLSDHQLDAAYFKINNDTGELTNLQTLSQIPRNRTTSYFLVQVEARDNPTSGDSLTTRTQVVINPLTDSNIFVLQVENAFPSQFRNFFDNLVKSLQRRTGACQVLGLWRTEDVSDSSTRTDAYMYAINPVTKTVCTHDQLSTLFNTTQLPSIQQELQLYYDVRTIRPSSQEAKVLLAGDGGGLGGALNRSRWTPTQIGLIVLACLIALGSVIAICALCCCWARARSKAKRAAMYGGGHDKPSLYAIFPTSGAPPSKYNTLYMPPSPMIMDKEYETQMLEMAMSEDMPSKDGLDVGFTVTDGVYSIRPATHSGGMYSHRPMPQPDVIIPPPDYPTSSDSDIANGHGPHRAYRNGHVKNHKDPYQKAPNEKTTML